MAWSNWKEEDERGVEADEYIPKARVVYDVEGKGGELKAASISEV